MSFSYEEYQSHLRALGAAAGPTTTLYDVAKWQFARILGGGIIFGGWILGSMLMGLGWLGKTLEEIRNALESELEAAPPRGALSASQDSNS